jgi:hypothetical protein
LVFGVSAEVSPTFNHTQPPTFGQRLGLQDPVASRLVRSLAHQTEPVPTFAPALHEAISCLSSATVSETKKTRAVVGLSGGVDSSAGAWWVAESYDAVGLTLKLWPPACAPDGMF